jgi:uncharacterized protein
MKEFSAFSVLLTENCNLSCKYCYEVLSSGHKNVSMSAATASRAVDFMFEHAKNSSEISISFFGGEPTLMPDIIDIMCIRGKELSKKYKKSFKVGMITNATVMNEKLYNIIKSHLDIWTSTQLSVDGPWDIQDEYRVTKSGGGTFATIEKNLPYWKELFKGVLSVHGVLNKKSIPRLFESYKYFREVWKEDRLWFLPAKSSEYTQEDVDLYDRELGKIYNYIMDRVRSSKSTKEIEYYAPLDRSLRNGKSSKPCGAGENYCTITSSGEIWPCHHFYFIDVKKELHLGSIWDGVSESRKRVWDEYDSSDIIGCEDCEHPACYRCIAENYEANNNPFLQVKGFHCKFMMVDLHYQKLIRKELIDMGLMKKENVKSDSGDACNIVARDCVGKQGDCPVVVSLDECKFDRSQIRNDNGTRDFKDVVEGPKDDVVEGPKDDVVAKTCGGSCACGEKNEGPTLKETVDKIIKALVDYHNSL